MRHGPRSSEGNRAPNSPHACLSGPVSMPPLAMYPPRTDSPIGDSRNLLLTSLGITNLPPNNSCIICGMGPLPCHCHSAEQVILAPRAVNSLRSHRASSSPLFGDSHCSLTLGFSSCYQDNLGGQGGGGDPREPTEAWWGVPGGEPTWKPSRMHRYQGGTSSILYNMSDFGSVGSATGGALVEVPAKPRATCWGQQRTVTQDEV